MLKYSYYILPEIYPHLLVSFQSIIQAVNSLVVGLSEAQEEIIRLTTPGAPQPGDCFVEVMQVLMFNTPCIVLSFSSFAQPFVLQVTPTVEALKKMGASVDAEMRSLLVYYGENPDGPDAPKPEDFFALVLAFSSSLQVLEHHLKKEALLILIQEMC